MHRELRLNPTWEEGDHMVLFQHSCGFCLNTCLVTCAIKPEAPCDGRSVFDE